MIFNSCHLSYATTGGTDVIDITGDVAAQVREAGIGEGQVLISVPGSTASITTIEYERGVVRPHRRPGHRPGGHAYATTPAGAQLRPRPRRPSQSLGGNRSTAGAWSSAPGSRSSLSTSTARRQRRIPPQISEYNRSLGNVLRHRFPTGTGRIKAPKMASTGSW